MTVKILAECRDYCSDKCLKWAVELYLENVHKGREQFFEIESRDNPVSLQEETRIHQRSE